ncbi:MAG: radical SAM protein [Myxococcota bacterium]|nr:radical SAM protein [Myxococcota bacterium]
MAYRFPIRNYARIAQAALTRNVPVYAHFGVTHRCNLTCKMCGIWRYGNAKEELSIPETREVARRMRRLGVAQVSIGGGEPFARDDLEDLVQGFIDEGLNTRVLTNGIGIPKSRIDRLIDGGLKNFSISLDSLYPERFDYICEHEGSWDEAVETMTHISSRLKGVGGAMPTINCVVSNLNLEELPELVHFAKAIGFAISFLPIELLETASSGVRNWEARFIRYRPEMGLNNADTAASVHRRVDNAYDQLIAMKSDGFPILNSSPYLEASRSYLKSGRFPLEGCDAGKLYFSVAPNGQFTICHRTQHQHLDFLDPDFEQYFHSNVYEQRRMLEAGGCEGCMRACWIDTSSMFRTVRGFFETARLTLSAPTDNPLSFTEAKRWAKHDPAGVVPSFA